MGVLMFFQLTGKERDYGGAPSSPSFETSHFCPIPLAGTPRRATPSSKGGWECPWLQFPYSSRTDLGRWLPLWILCILLGSRSHPYSPSGARPSVSLSAFCLGVLRQVAQPL